MIQDLITSVREAIKADATFTNALVYERAELADDIHMSLPLVFITVMPVTTTSTPHPVSFLTIPLEVVVKFARDGRGNENEPDGVNVQKSLYNQELYNLLIDFVLAQEYPEGFYSASHVSTDMNWKETGVPYEDTYAQEYRIRQLWNFYGYYPEPPALVTELGEYIILS